MFKCLMCEEETDSIHVTRAELCDVDNPEGYCDHCIPNVIESPGAGFWKAYFKIYKKEDQRWEKEQTVPSPG